MNSASEPGSDLNKTTTTMCVVNVALPLHSQYFTPNCNFRKKNMKKLALAPAVALAITGLAASPVIAAPDASAPAPSADTQPAKSPVQLQKGAAQGVTAPAGAISVSAENVTIDEFAAMGVGIAGAGLEAETEYSLTVEPASGQNVNVYETTVTTDADGAFEDGVEAVGNANPAFIGDYKVTVTNIAD